jgi:hypothetical protein
MGELPTIAEQARRERLRAYAPELLSALEALIAALPDPNHQWDQEIREATIDARGAIALAGGKLPS